jgi:hypothetical protein
MSIPLLKSPLNNSIVFDPATVFTWIHLHDSTTNGHLSNYEIEIDNDPDFTSPAVVETTFFPFYSNPSSPLPDDIYYWRVKANYSTPPGISPGWSEVWAFTVSGLAPTNLKIFVDYIDGEISLNWTRSQSGALDHLHIYRSIDPHDFNFTTPYNNSLSWPDPMATNWVDPDIGSGSDNSNYFYIVRGVNNTGFEEQNMNIVGKYVSWLNKGWNLVSVPLKQSNTSITRVLTTIKGNYDIIQWYNSEDGKWHNSNGDLTDIDHKMGFWIHMKTSAKLILNGSVINSVFHLSKGWNHVGYPSFVKKSVDNVFSEVPSFVAVQCFNNSDTSDHWKHHKEHKPFGNDLITLNTGLGYWVYVTSSSYWYVNY